MVTWGLTPVLLDDWMLGCDTVTEPLTCGIWCYLCVNSVKTESNCRTPSWYLRIAWQCWVPSPVGIEVLRTFYRPRSQDPSYTSICCHQAAHTRPHLHFHLIIICILSLSHTSHYYPHSLRLTEDGDGIGRLQVAPEISSGGMQSPRGTLASSTQLTADSSSKW